MSDCIEWAGALNSSGYGPHRRVFEKVHGKQPSHVQIMHSCDNRKCINLEHLSAGSKSDNFRDMQRKGRANYTGAKLDCARVEKIKSRLAKGEAHAGIASDFGVTRYTISHIATGRTWTHVQV